ncbi:hypothetical protein VP01_4125g1, partial [Puccinia sorghi]
IIWGLLKQSLVPRAPELQNLQEFYDQFSNAQQIQTAASTANLSSLIKSNKVECFKEVKSGQIMISNSVIHMPNNMIQYACSLMTCLGMRVCLPNCYHNNFQRACSSTHLKLSDINLKRVTETNLLIQAYNNYFHFFVSAKYKKEQKEEGKIQKYADKRNFQKIKDMANKLPNRYIKIEESTPSRNYHTDQKIMKHRIRPPIKPHISEFKVAPKGLALDFYDPKLFKGLPPVQQKTVTTHTKVALLPDTNESLLPKPHTHCYKREAYGLLDADDDVSLSGKRNDNHEDGNKNKDDKEGEEINLYGPSPNASKDELLPEGETVNMYDTTDEKEDGSHQEEDDSGEENSDEEMYEFNGQRQWE